MDEIAIDSEKLETVLRLAFDAQEHDYGCDVRQTDAMRVVAVALGLNPSDFTPSEFKGMYPHTFEPAELSLNEFRGRVPDGVKDTTAFGQVVLTRPETDAEILARIGPIEPVCKLYTCQRPADNLIHDKDLDRTS